MWLEIAANALCVVLVLGSLGVAAWEIITGKAMEQGADGLFLVILCLLFAAMFSFLPLQSYRSGELRRLLARKPGKADEKVEPQAEPPAEEKSKGTS